MLTYTTCRTLLCTQFPFSVLPKLQSSLPDEAIQAEMHCGCQKDSVFRLVTYYVTLIGTSTPIFQLRSQDRPQVTEHEVEMYEKVIQP